MKSQGFSLVEALVAVAIFSIVLAGVIPGFTSNLQFNNNTDIRVGAVSAARTSLESLRARQIGSMISTENTVVEIGKRQYDVTVKYCVQTPNYCTPSSKEILVEVKFNGKIRYSTTTVYTQLE